MTEPPKSLEQYLGPPGASTRAGRTALRSLGVFAGGLGLYVSYGSITALVRQTDPSERSLFRLISDVLLGLFAIWCLASCYRAWKPGRTPPIRSLSTIVALGVGCAAMHWLPQPTEQRNVGESLALFGEIVLICAVYLSLTWWLASALSVPRASGRIPQLVIVAVSFSVWLAAFAVLDGWIPREGDPKNGPPMYPWGFIDLIVPFAAAVLSAKFLGWIGKTHEAPRFGRTPAPNR